MSNAEICARATRFRDETTGAFRLFLPLILFSIVAGFIRLVFAVKAMLSLRLDSALVAKKLTMGLVGFSVLHVLVFVLLQFLIYMVSFHLLQFVRGQRPQMDWRDSISYLWSDWLRPISLTIFCQSAVQVLASLPAIIGANLTIAGLVMKTLMILSPGAMGMLARYQPERMMTTGLVTLLVGLVLALVVAYTYSQVPFVLYDLLDNGAYQHPLAVLKESRLLMKGNYWRRFYLDLSFIGWFIGELLTIHLLAFYVKPYYHMARTVFYEEIAKEKELLA